MISRVALNLTSLSAPEPIILVSATEAVRRCQSGAQSISSGRALALFLALDRLAASDVRPFVDEARLTGMRLSGLDDAELRDLVRRAILDGRLVAVRPGADTAAGPKSDLRRLVRSIEKAARGLLRYGGREYKLVVDMDLAKVPGRDSYEVVGHEDGRGLLEQLAKQARGQGDLSSLLAQALAKLTQDWRPPLAPDGLVLLRKIPVVQGSASTDGPALTPSELKKLKDPPKDAWITIQLVDADSGKPIDGAALSLTLPKESSASSHQTDDKGVIDLRELPSGACTLEGIDDDEAWELVSHEIS